MDNKHISHYEEQPDGSKIGVGYPVGKTPSASETIKEKSEMILTSIQNHPCKIFELKKREFLETTSDYGIERLVFWLIQSGDLLENNTGMLTVSPNSEILKNISK